MNSTIQTNQKFSKKLENILTFSLLAASIISLTPAKALGNNHQPPPDIFNDSGIQQYQPTKSYRQRRSKVKTTLLIFTLICSASLTLTLLFADVVLTAVCNRLNDNVKGNVNPDLLGEETLILKNSFTLPC